jgi:PAS domain S-box-containing protein
MTLAGFLPTGIRARLFLLIALVLLPLSLIMGWIYYERFEVRRSQALQTELEVAQGLAASFTAFVVATHRLSQSLGQTILIVPASEAGIATDILTSTAAQYPAIRNITWTSPEGVAEVSSNPQNVGLDLSSRPYVQQILSGRPWVIADLAPQGITVGRVTLTIAVGIRDQNSELKGIVVTSIEPLGLGALILPEARPAGGRLVIFDRQGTVVYREPELPLAWEERQQWLASDPLLSLALETGTAQSGEVELAVPEGRRLATRIPIPEIGWVAGSDQPLEVALVPVREQLRQDVTLAGLIASAAFLLAWFVSRTIAGPLRTLEADARAMGEGGRLIHQDDPAAPAEISRLRATVEGLAEGLLTRAEDLRSSEERYRLVNVATNDVIWDWDLGSDELLWNQGLQRVFGYPLETVAAEIGWWYDHLHPEDRERVVAGIHDVINGGGESWTAEYRFRRQDGSFATVFDRGHIQRDDQGRPIRMVGSMLDLTERLRQEEALRRSEAQFRQLADALPQLVWITRPDGYHEYFNRRWHEYTGTTLEDTKGDLWSTLLHPDDYQRSIARWRQSLDTGEPYQIEYRFRRAADGAYRWFLGLALPVRDKGGGIFRWFGTCTDIHDLKDAEEKLHQSEEKFRSVFEQAAVGIGRVSFSDARWIDVNEAFCRMLGYSSEEIRAIPWPQITHPEDVDSDLILFRRMAAGELDSYTVEKRFIHKQGHPVWARLALSLARDVDGRPEYEIAVIENITDMKRSEEEIHRLNADLERRVEERTAELTAANQELEAFTYTVSHDLRAPLRHISSFTELLEKEVGPQLNEQGQRYMRVIGEASRRMGALIDDLLMFSRLGRATIRKTPVNLARLVEQARAELAPETTGRNIDWRIGALPQVEGDATLLRSVLLNLLGNALKYSQRREPMRIEIGSRKEKGELIVFVRDNGAGFDMRYADKLFGVFQRLHPASKFEGTGIGLASVRRIIERHGGRVWAEGEVDKGATFYFALPVGQEWSKE